MRFKFLLLLAILFSKFSNAQSLIINSPLHSEVYSNDIVKISWLSDEPVNIDYSVNSGLQWLPIASNLPAEDSVFEWMIPEVNSTNIQIRVANGKSQIISLKLKHQKLNNAYYKWLNVSDNVPFYKRDGAGALVFKDKLWLIGGWNPEKNPVCNSEIWNSEDGINWNLVTVAPWEERHTAGYVVFKNKIWVIGGDVNSGHYQNDIWNTDDGISWTKVTDSVPWGDRCLSYTVAFKDKIYVIGGQKMIDISSTSIIYDPLELYNDVWSSTDGIKWSRELKAAPWSERGMICGNAVHDGKSD